MFKEYLGNNRYPQKFVGKFGKNKNRKLKVTMSGKNLFLFNLNSKARLCLNNRKDGDSHWPEPML